VTEIEMADAWADSMQREPGEDAPDQALLTAETITDAEIIELRDGAHAHGDGDPDFVVRLCERALRKRDRKLETQGQYERVRAAARERCAAIINARSA
jgi:hypothetical protein